MRPRVLVVDDYEDNLLLFAEELRAADYDVIATTNGNEALNLALLNKPAVVVTDISMPQLDGYELARLLRSYSATKDTRLIAVSAFMFTHEGVPPGGWDACLRKPIEPGTLAGAVRTILGGAIPAVRESGPIERPFDPSRSNGTNH